MKILNSLMESISHLVESAETQELFFASFFLVVALIGPWIAQRVIGGIFRRLLRKLDGDLVESAIQAIKGPLAIYIFVTFAVLSINVFEHIPKGLQRFTDYAETVLNGIAVLVFSFRVVDIVAILFKRRMMKGAKTELDERWVKIVGWVGKGIVLFVGIISIMQGLGKSIVPYITGAGVFGAAFALAAQSTLGNIIGSFEIMMDRLFAEGDRIAFGEYDGFVTKMGLRSVEITALSGEKINLPNKDLVDKQIRNYSKGKVVFGKIGVGLEYRHTKEEVERAIHVLKEVALAHPKISEANAVFKSFASSSLDLELYFWGAYKTGGEYISIVSDLNMEIKERFDREKFGFAFPSSSIYLKKE